MGEGWREEKKKKVNKTCLPCQTSTAPLNLSFILLRALQTSLTPSSSRRMKFPLTSSNPTHIPVRPLVISILAPLLSLPQSPSVLM